MIKVLTQQASTAFSRLNTPTLKQEIESKYNLQSLAELNTLSTAVIQSGHADIRFSQLNPEPYLNKDHAMHGLLKTHPVSWYLDTKDKTALLNSLTIRGRLTVGDSAYNEFSIKGQAQEFSGPGGSIRHEDERFTPHFGFFASDFADDPISATLIDIIGEEPLIPYFATDVPRTLIGVRVELDNGKQAIFEVAFDNLRYIHHDDSSETGITQFAQLHQLEIEYFNPLDKKDPTKMSNFAEALGLDVLTNEEVEIALTQVSNVIHDLAAQHSIELAPTDISKGRFGYEERNRQGLATETRMRFDANGKYYWENFEDNNAPIYTAA